MFSELKSDNILVIDTALNGCCVGVYGAREGCVISKSRPMASGQAEHLMPLIQEAIKEAGLSFADLGAVASTVGPGAFTGLRIGLSAAKSLGLALDIPVFGVTTLQALAAQYVARNSEAKNFAVILETKRADFYCQVFSNDGEAITAPQALSGDELKLLLNRHCEEACKADAAIQSGSPHDNLGSGLLRRDAPRNDDSIIIIGDGAERFLRSVDMPGLIFDPAYSLVDAGFVAALFKTKSVIFSHNVEPLYLRDADVTISKKTQRILKTD